MQRKIQLFLSAFAIAMICIGTIGGFIAVDLSIDRYMPNQFSPIFEIKSIREDSTEFGFLGNGYHIDAAAIEELRQELGAYRGLLPAQLRIAAYLAALGMREIINTQDEQPQ